MNKVVGWLLQLLGALVMAGVVLAAAEALVVLQTVHSLRGWLYLAIALVLLAAFAGAGAWLFRRGGRLKRS